MEYIGIGLMLAIGFYLAPVVITALFGLVAIIGAGVASLFGGGK